MSSAASGPDIVALAREWIGTPYRHQASRRGAGADCLGLIRGIWRELYGAEPEVPPAYTPDWGEPGQQEILWRAATAHLDQRADGDRGLDGDVLLFRMREGRVAKHLGIAATGPSGPTFIHAMSGYGVLESPLSTPWERRIAARFAFPDME